MIPTIHATSRCEPPAWARLQRRLLATMSEAAREASARYSFPDGTATFVEDVDDAYEARAGRGALYASAATTTCAASPAASGRPPPASSTTPAPAATIRSTSPS